MRTKKTFRDIVMKPPARPKPVQLPPKQMPVSYTCSTEDLEMAMSMNIEWGDIVSAKSIADIVRKKNAKQEVAPSPLPVPTKAPSPTSIAVKAPSPPPVPTKAPSPPPVAIKAQNPTSIAVKAPIPTKASSPPPILTNVLSPPVSPEKDEPMPVLQSPPCSAKTTDSEPKEISFHSPPKKVHLNELFQEIITNLPFYTNPRFIDILNIVYSRIGKLPFRQHDTFWSMIYRYYNIQTTKHRQTTSCSPSMGRTFSSQVNKRTSFYTTNETALPKIPKPPKKYTFDEVKQRRDTLASEITRTPSNSIQYNWTLFKKFNSGGYKQWCKYDEELNRISYENTFFVGLYKSMWSIFINGEHVGTHCSEKEAREFGKDIVKKMEFPFTVGVFEIKNTSPYETSITQKCSEIDVQTNNSDAAIASKEVSIQTDDFDTLDAPQPSQEASIQTDDHDALEAHKPQWEGILSSLEEHMHNQNEQMVYMQAQLNELYELYESIYQNPVEEKTIWQELWESFWCFRRRS